ncbi:MAG: O-antigen ligase family protein [Verrucomicrobiota bacterium]|nr:O-antigen ligase family protein [Verrucomicrobiota bacterium]MEC8405427.1 O-antigen ligase family protein [Verrucomicrobiota bacterium]
MYIETRFKLSKFALTVLLVSALVFLPYPNFVTGTTAAIIVSIIYALAWCTEPTTKILNFPLTVFLLIVGLSMFWVNSPELTFRDVGATAIAALVGYALGTRLNLKEAMSIIENAIGLIAILSLLLFFIAPDYALDQRAPNKGTLLGFYSQKNGLSLVLLIGFVTTLLQQSKTLEVVCLRFLLLGVYLVDFWLAKSLTTYVLCFSSLAMRFILPIWVLHRHRSRYILFLIGTIAALPLCIVLIQSVEITLNYFGKDLTFSSRVGRWKILLNAWVDRPLLGYGWGSFSTDLSIINAQEKEYGHIATNTQNGFLQVLTEIGLIGLAAYLFIWFKTTYSVFCNTIRARNVWDFWPALMLFNLLINNLAEQGTRGAQLVILTMIIGFFHKDSSGCKT